MSSLLQLTYFLLSFCVNYLGFSTSLVWGAKFASLKDKKRCPSFYILFFYSFFVHSLALVSKLIPSLISMDSSISNIKGKKKYILYFPNSSEYFSSFGDKKETPLVPSNNFLFLCDSWLYSEDMFVESSQRQEGSVILCVCGKCHVWSISSFKSPVWKRSHFHHREWARSQAEHYQRERNNTAKTKHYGKSWK